MHVQTCYFHEEVHYGPPDCYHETELNQAGLTAQTPQSINQPYWEET